MPDNLQRFFFEHLDIRGSIVSLDCSLRGILTQHHYPELIGSLLGEALTATTLLTSTIQLKGRLIMQLQNQGPIRLLVTKCNQHHHITGLARWDETHDLEALENTLNQGKLVITLLPDNQVEPQQSIISLQQQSIASALEDYFSQSEQLPTKLWIKANHQRAVGLLLQLLPQRRLETESTQDFYLETARLAHQDIFNDLFSLSSDVLLQKLFPAQDIRLLDPEPIHFQCDCSIERMKNAILTLGHPEAEEILKQKQVIDVTCDFCAKSHAFSREEVNEIFRKYN